jgi:ABC-2 type transport system ATP-binding protein
VSDQPISVKTNQLTRRFGKFVAVDQVSIEVYRREIFGFLGANGAGKTTMIRMLCGLLRPSDGDGTVARLDINAQSEMIKKNIGYMSQKFSLYEDLTISENIEFYGGVYGLSKHTIQQKKDELFRDLPLGIRQRLALGSALLHDPPIVFLDEPTSGVDPKARRGFWDLIHQTAESGKTVFVTTHYMEEAEYCHRISIMREGKLIAVGSPGDLREKYRKKSMQEVFVSLVQSEGVNN